ncbi:MAG: hypothetical protein ABSA63_04085 [Thermoplasmata archaeon]|jgi:hypothetical protein
MKRPPAPTESVNPSKATACADYTFRQRFRVPAPWAFRWCTDFTPDDSKLSAGHASRKVLWLSARTVALDDEFLRPTGERVRKVKLVQIYPAAKYWVSTHIVGPNRSSQFRYTIRPGGANASYLLFEGRDLMWEGRPLSSAANRERSRRLRTEDSGLWKRFATTMENDHSKR